MLRGIKMKNVRAAIRMEVPDWQIGQPVTVYFKDTMCKRGICELDVGDVDMKEYIAVKDEDDLVIEKEFVRCKDCKKHGTNACTIAWNTPVKTPDDWYCGDGHR